MKKILYLVLVAFTLSVVVPFAEAASPFNAVKVRLPAKKARVRVIHKKHKRVRHKRRLKNHKRRAASLPAPQAAPAA